MSIIKSWLRQISSIFSSKLLTYSAYVICIIFFIILCCSIRRCNYYKKINNNNIEAFTDSIHYYKDKAGQLVASKLLIEGEYNDLKKINKELYDKVNAMKIDGGKPEKVIKVDNVIYNELHDTIIVVKDSVAKFDFTNQYRSLSGSIYTHKDSLGLSITKDEVYFDYNIVLKDNKVWLSSSNPYVKYNEITGITVPKDKKKKWGIGPVASVGIDVKTGKLVPSIGLGITYHILEW